MTRVLSQLTYCASRYRRICQPWIKLLVGRNHFLVLRTASWCRWGTISKLTLYCKYTSGDNHNIANVFCLYRFEGNPKSSRLPQKVGVFCFPLIFNPYMNMFYSWTPHVKEWLRHLAAPFLSICCFDWDWYWPWVGEENSGNECNKREHMRLKGKLR